MIYCYTVLEAFCQESDKMHLASYVVVPINDIFQIPWEDRATQTTATLRTFLTFAEPVIELSIAQAQEMGPSF